MFSYILRCSLAVTIRLSLNIGERLRYTYERIYCVVFNEIEPLIFVYIEHLVSKEYRSNDFNLLTFFFLKTDVSQVGISGMITLLKTAR